MSATRTRVLRAAAGLLAAAAVLWLVSLAWVLAAGGVAALRPADAILVLGAAQYNGRPSPVYRSRLDHALSLHRRRLAPVLVFTGGVGTGDTVSEGEVGRRYALRHGVPPQSIMVEGRGLTSAESIGGAAALMLARDLHSALVVSDSYHMLRLELLARRAGIRAFPAPAPGAPIDRNREARWRYVLRESVLFPATAILGAR